MEEGDDGASVIHRRSKKRMGRGWVEGSRGKVNSKRGGVGDWIEGE